MVRKIYLFALIFFVCCFQGEIFAHQIDDVIRSNPQMASAIIGISVKDANSGQVLYEHNSKTLVHPASTLKLITSSAVVDYLGKDYIFKNAIYKNGDKTYLQVGADPLFSISDAKNLLQQYATKNQGIIKNFIIDDTIIDDIPYGTGWQWDDNTNTLMPQMSPYTINNNIFTVKVGMTAKNRVGLETSKEYTEKITNNLKFSNKDDIRIYRDIFQPENPIILDGTISRTQFIDIPAINPKELYLKIIAAILIENNIPFNAMLKYEKVPMFSSQTAIVIHSIKDVLKEVNCNSNNLAAELLVKHAGASKLDGTGTTKAGIEVIKDFYNKNGLNTDNIIIVDGSGVSMNDYVSADFMTYALIVIKKSRYFDFIKESMSDTENGTFKGRTPELSGKLKVKTGTLANTSAVVGYVQTYSGKNLVFSIMIDNLSQHNNAKEFENKIIKAISDL